MNDLPGARGYHAFPLAGTPVGRLQDDATRMLASGMLPRCPHPDQPAFWYLAVKQLSCGPCTDELVRAVGDEAATCHACGGRASAVAAWVTGGVPCLASLCEACHSDGVVEMAPN